MGDVILIKPVMSQSALKLSVAKQAIQFVPENSIIGVGTGSTVNFFIDELAKIKDRIKGAVASSIATQQRLQSHGISVIDLSQIQEKLPVYIDGADEITMQGEMIKGGGGALTREKIIAFASKQFICIADQSKLVSKLGRFPLPIEVIPMAAQYLAQSISQITKGTVTIRQKDNKNFVTDNGNLILDVAGLTIEDPKSLEKQLNCLPGVVTVGLFAINGAKICLLGETSGVRKIIFNS